MSATVPGAPKMSRRTCFGLNWMIASALPLSGLYIFEPKTPCSRATVSAAMATTTTMTRGTHIRATRRVIALLPSGCGHRHPDVLTFHVERQLLFCFQHYHCVNIIVETTPDAQRRL